MGGAASKRKGSGGELQLAKLLSGIFAGSFIRSPGSGAFVGGKNAARKRVLSAGQTRTNKGDLVAPDFMPYFVVEAKTYREFRFHQLLQPGPCQQLDDWIKQTLDVIDPGDLWIVAFKADRLGWFLAVDATASEDWVFRNHARYDGPHGSFRVADLVSCLTDNRARVLRDCAARPGVAVQS